ncbi:MAG: hypothetical protein E7084_06585 [Bacteroidales bacterium]|nr:hypothetical protein [Bacteroidales bacterium]
MKRNFYTFAALMIAATTAFAQESSFADLMKAPAEVIPATEEDVIWTPPCVEEGHSYEMVFEIGCKGFTRTGLTDVEFDSPNGGRGIIVADTRGDKYYIKNPLPRTHIGSYIEGTLVEEGDNVYIECQLPQWLNAREASNQGVKMVVGRKIVNPDGMIFYDPVTTAEENVIRYVMTEDEGFVLEFDDPELAVVATYAYLDEEGDGIFAGAAIERVKYSDPGNKTPVTMPEGVTAQKWGMIYSNGLRVHNVQCGIQDDKVYLAGVAPQFPENCVVGTINGETITFEANQYLGETETTYEYLVFNKAKFISSSDRGDVYNFEGDLLPSCEAVYDATAHTISCPMDEAWFCNAGTGHLYYADFWVGPMFMPDMGGAATPSDPEILEWMEYMPAVGYGGFIADLPLLGTNGEILSPEFYTYIVYFDGEPFTFTPEEYPGVPEPMTEIPYNFEDGEVEDFRVEGTNHIICWRADGYESFGIQGVYTYDGVTNKSNVVSQELEGAAVKGNHIDYPEVRDVKFYDLTGREVINPENGIYIKRINFVGGKSISEKVVINRK